MADEVRFPVDLDLTQFEAKIRQLRQRLEAGINQISQQAAQGQVSTTAKERMQVGSQEFEIAARTRMRKIAAGPGQPAVEIPEFRATIREIRKTTRKALSDEEKRLRDFLTKIKREPLETQQPALEGFRQKHGDINNLLGSRLRVIQERLDRKLFDQIKKNLEGLDPLSQISSLRQFQRSGVGGRKLQREAERLIQRQMDKLDKLQRQMLDQLAADQSGLDKLRMSNIRDKFNTTKRNLSGMQPEDIIKGWQDYLNAGGPFVDIERGKKELQKAVNQWVQQQKTGRRAKFRDWTTKLKGLDPQTAINELDKYIGQQGSVFVNEAKAMRARLAKQMANSQAAAMREQQRKFANRMLVGSGIGLGLFGAAGFPLLNIGFSAMSGGPVGAGIVGAATAIGELSRAIQALHESSKSMAKEISFVSTAFKEAESRSKAFQAVIGSGGLSSERAAMETRFKMFENMGVAANNLNRLWGDIRSSIGTDFRRQALEFTSSKGFFSTFSLLTRPPRIGEGLFGTFLQQQELSRKFATEDIQSALLNFRKEMARPTVRMETDPLESWRRIQNSALDPTKQNEMRLQQKMLEMLEKQVAALEANTEAVSGESKKSAQLDGGGSY